MSDNEHRLIGKKEFTTSLVLERSSSPTMEPLGTHASTMELYFRTGKESATGFIDWDIPALDQGESIGLWFDIDPAGVRTLTDYDGIFSLPKQAVELMREHGIVVPNEFDDAGTA